jgi:glycosyltransferase involved in cell wall biosynthesis
LPTRFRQKLAHNIIDVFMPRVQSPGIDLTDPHVPRIVIGLLSSPSGLGQSARLAAAALRTAGFPVYGIDLTPWFFGSEGGIAHRLPNGRALKGPAHLLVVINSPYMPYVLSLLGSRATAGRHITGYWAWELPRVPESWRRGLAAVHDVAVPSSFCSNAVASLDTSLPIRVAPHPVALEPRAAATERASLPIGPFTVISTFDVASGYVRKNPVAAVRAFRRAFGTSPAVRLKLLAGNPRRYERARRELLAAIDNAANIEVVWNSLSDSEYRTWWGRPDVYFSMHRAEGFGLGIAEAMCSGISTVATGWSGNMDFMTGPGCHPVQYCLTDVDDDQGKYHATSGQWAEPNIDNAAALLATIADRRAASAAEALRAANSVRRRLSAEAFVTQLCSPIPELKCD